MAALTITDVYSNEHRKKGEGMTNCERGEYGRLERLIKKAMVYLNLKGSVEIFQVAEEAKTIPRIRKGVEVWTII